MRQSPIRQAKVREPSPYLEDDDETELDRPLTVRESQGLTPRVEASRRTSAGPASGRRLSQKSSLKLRCKAQGRSKAMAKPIQRVLPKPEDSLSCKFKVSWTVVAVKGPSDLSRWLKQDAPVAFKEVSSLRGARLLRRGRDRTLVFPSCNSEFARKREVGGCLSRKVFRH